MEKLIESQHEIDDITALESFILGFRPGAKTVIGHVSSSTMLNVYAHVTDEMRRTAAVKIDHGIGKADPPIEREAAPRKPAPSTFQAHKGQRRKAGTGCVTQINEKLWEGRYSPVWPDGKKHARNVYAHGEEECEKTAGRHNNNDESKDHRRESAVKGHPKSRLTKVYDPSGHPDGPFFLSVAGYMVKAKYGPTIQRYSVARWMVNLLYYSSQKICLEKTTTPQSVKVLKLAVFKSYRMYDIIRQ